LNKIIQCFFGIFDFIQNLVKFGKKFVKNLVNKNFSTQIKGLLTGKTKADFDAMIQNDVACEYDGYMFHSSLGYGKMIKTYPFPCQSAKSSSWPLFLRGQQSGGQQSGMNDVVFTVLTPGLLHFAIFANFRKTYT